MFSDVLTQDSFGLHAWALSTAVDLVVSVATAAGLPTTAAKMVGLPSTVMNHISACATSSVKPMASTDRTIVWMRCTVVRVAAHPNRCMSTTNSRRSGSETAIHSANARDGQAVS